MGTRCFSQRSSSRANSVVRRSATRNTTAPNRKSRWRAPESGRRRVEARVFEKVLHAEKKATGKSPRFYAPEDVKAPLAKKATNKPTKLRSSLTPGTVLILLAGHFKGKRVIFLKQL